MLSRRKFLKFLAFSVPAAAIAPGAIANAVEKTWAADPASGRWVEIHIRTPLKRQGIDGDSLLCGQEEFLAYETERVWKPYIGDWDSDKPILRHDGPKGQGKPFFFFNRNFIK